MRIGKRALSDNRCKAETDDKSLAHDKLKLESTLEFTLMQLCEFAQVILLY